MDTVSADVADILDAYRVDQPHARHVANLALALFDAVAQRYNLPSRSRSLLEIGALLHNVGLTTDPPQHHLVGRDIVLRHTLNDIDVRDQVIIACLVAFHRKKVRPQLEPAFLGLGKKSQALAMRLSAILRVADGLDASQSQTTHLLHVEPGDHGLTFSLDGVHAATDGVRALDKADLWRKVFAEELCIAPVEPNVSEVAVPAASVLAHTDEAPEEALLSPWYSASNVPLADLGRVLLRRHFRRMLLAERAVRTDRSIEDIHDLRVSTRRLRATLRLLAPVAPAAPLRPIQKAIRRLARAAGAVRDRDVLLAHLMNNRTQLPDEHQAGIDVLAATIVAQRVDAYACLIHLLDSDAHAAFKADFANLMNDCAGWNELPRVCDLAGSTIWRHYEALRSYDRGGLPEIVPELHAMRIDAKKLRYVLELFADSFGDRATPVVAQLASLQDELGVLNDVAVAQDTLAATQLDADAQMAADTYLALRATQLQVALKALPVRWEKVGSATYRRKLMELIVRL
ncbi:MAG: CHAD domain-containing protein [Oscillochloris sp.]|nr:CHAD domain-containing protein [Oscillochloris sp.]